MKIAGGEFRSRILKVPKSGVRPTSDKVRQAVFNMLDARGAVDGAYALDAFCGSGALGLEALSRGAAFCVFWDKSKESVQCTRDNIAALGVEDRALWASKDIAKIGTRPEADPPFTLVFLDPPYDKGLIPAALRALRAGGWLAAEALIVMEMRDSEQPAMDRLEIVQEKIYGDTKVLLAYNTPE